MSERDELRFCPFCFKVTMQTLSGSGRKGICHDCTNDIFHDYQDYLEQNLLTSEELKQIHVQTIALEKNLDRINRRHDD